MINKGGYTVKKLLKITILSIIATVFLAACENHHDMAPGDLKLERGEQVDSYTSV